MGLSSAVVSKLREWAARFDAIDAELADPAVATDHRRTAELMRERGKLAEAHRLAGEIEHLTARRAEAEALIAADEDPELTSLAREDLGAIAAEENALDRRAKEALVSDPELERDKFIVEVRAGTGGDEATLFTADLFRMYQRFADAKGWKVEVLSTKPSEIGGFKEVVLGLRGPGAYRLFRFEAGGHRVQRVPETESQGRIHTSAATVAVLPEPEDVEIAIAPDDLRIDTMRAGGAGGQHVNKTESAVRIVHIPTNTTVVCMDDKSQHKNRAQAMRILRTRLYELEQKRLHDARAAARKEQVGSGDRSERIRTYNFPQNRCSDHRLGENFPLEGVLAGKLEPILVALDERDREERIKDL
jgi:peptide chain release factor 1